MTIDSTAYTVLGQGEYPVLAFHGFSQDYRAFEELSKNAPSLRIYCFKLFAHGFSTPETQELSRAHWVEAMGEWLRKQPWDKCGLLAFSMGNRPALQLLRYYPEIFDHVALLAPEGMSIHPVFWLATRSSIGRGIFRRAANPRLLTYIVRKMGHLMGWPLAITSLWMREIAQQPDRLYKAWQAYQGWEVLPKDLLPILPADLPINIWLAKGDPYVRAGNPTLLSRQHLNTRLIRPRCTHFHLLNFYSRAYPKLPKEQRLCHSEKSR